MLKELTLTNKLEKLTCVDESNFNYLLNLVMWIINDAVEEAIQSTNSEYCEVDIGIGVITYKIYDNKAVFYKFEPYKKFATFTYENKQSLLDEKAKNKLINALNERYKEYI